MRLLALSAGHAAAVIVAVMLVACGGGGSQGPQPGGTITGNERLGWDMQAASIAELAPIRYAIYIDNARSELAGAACTPPAGASGFPCSAPLPRMSPGEHTLELASFVVSGGTIIESPKSPPLRVTVGSGAGTGSGLIRIPDAPPHGDESATRSVVTADGIRLHLDIGPAYFHQPTDMAVTPDGRVFIAEKAGRVQIAEALDAQPRTALLPDEMGSAELSSALLGIALSPGFSGDSLVFLLSAHPGGDGPVFRISRFREVNGTLGERAVILDNVPASPGTPVGALRFGADARLYVALDDGGDPAEAARPASFNGKILRLNADGTAPMDEGRTSPVYSAGHSAPRGLAWHPATGAVWLLDSRGGDETVMLAEPDLHGLRVARPRARLPRLTDASAMVAYGSPLIAGLRGDLLVAAAGSGNLLRLRMDRRTGSAVASTERLLPDGLGPLRAVAVTPDGRIVAVGASLMILSPADR